MTLAEASPRSDLENKTPLIDPREAEGSKLFFERIGRPDLKEKLTAQKPWCYWTMEFYGKGVKGQGGLGVLAADTAEEAGKRRLPMVIMTPFYPLETEREIVGFWQNEVKRIISPEERGFKKEGTVSIATSGHPEVPLNVYVKRDGSVSVVTVSEPNFGELYPKDPNSDHRLYQEVALGFGGLKALELLGVSPSIHQLNEAPTIFAALARFDKHLSVVNDINSSLEEVRKNTIYTNHTLVQAVEADFTDKQLEHFVMPNIQHLELRNWLKRELDSRGGKIKLSDLAILLSGKVNGVSRIHAREASKSFQIGGEKVKFVPITNGIALDRWGDPELLHMYRSRGIVDEFDLQTSNFVEGIRSLDEERLRGVKEDAKIQLREALGKRKDQHGKGINIPEDALIYNWRRRMVDYKRLELLFTDPIRLANILEEKNVHLVISGNVHNTDDVMKYKLKHILATIDGSSIFKERVHFIQDYDIDISGSLAQGADVSINTPIVRDHGLNKRVSTEACGTSGMKDALNNVIIISTPDGWIADLEEETEEDESDISLAPYLVIKGRTLDEEARSLYNQIERAAIIIRGQDNNSAWGEFVKKQLEAYLPIISGSRMLSSYLKHAYPL